MELEKQVISLRYAKELKKKRLLEIYDEQQEVLMETVKISHNEVNRIVRNRLIDIRQSLNSKSKKHFDFVLKWFLTDAEIKNLDKEK